MILSTQQLEKQRLELQTILDNKKTKVERNRLGQFATPSTLAYQILEYALSFLPNNEPIRFLDPAIGSGAFYSALQASAISHPIQTALGFEIDEHYALPAQELWAKTPLQIKQADFTTIRPPTSHSELFNLLICNPPYIRHHHIASEDKTRLQQIAKSTFGVNLNGLAGMYCYFLALAHHWMQPNGVAAWLIPSEFMTVNYGNAIRHYLLNKVTLLHIHRFDPNDVQFDDALVSSAIVFFRNTTPPENNKILFSYGGDLIKPTISKIIPVNELANEPKWTRFPKETARKIWEGPKLQDFFQIKRGLATGDNDFFILTKDQIESLKLPRDYFRPILPSPRYIDDNEILADKQGNPIIERQLFLLDCNLKEVDIQERFPNLWNYLQTGIPQVSTRYLCSKRNPWYSQENRPPAPILCTYIGRSSIKREQPFRFILNHSQATAPNVYLMLYPKPPLTQLLKSDPSIIRQIWNWLNNIQISELLDEGRVYGGGLHKIEPKELANLNATGIAEILSHREFPDTYSQELLFK